MENHMKTLLKKLIVTNSAQQHRAQINKVRNMMQWVFITPYTPLKSPSLVS